MKRAVALSAISIALGSICGCGAPRPAVSEDAPYGSASRGLGGRAADAGVERGMFELPAPGAERYSTDGGEPAPLAGLAGEVRERIRRSGAEIVPDARLDEAAALVSGARSAGLDVSVELLREALWWTGVPEAAPVVGGFRGESGEAVVEKASEWLARRASLGESRYGVAQGSEAGGGSLVVVAVPSRVRLDPLPRRARPGEVIVVSGEASREYRDVGLAVADPSGRIREVEGTVVASRFSFEVPLSERGLCQIEIVGSDAGGPTVLANFPIAAGVSFDGRVGGEVAALESGDPDRLEALLKEMIDESRRERGLGPLARSASLDRVARAYSEEMKETGEVRHVSAVSGSAADRVRAAGLAFSRLKENLARAYSARQAHEGLMRSPVHRANILDERAFEVGIGVAVAREEGATAVLVTELFGSLPPPLDADAPDRIASAVNARRREAGRGELEVDARLAEIARRSLSGCFGGTPGPRVDLGGTPFAKVAVVSALAASVESVDGGDAPALMAEEYTHMGVAARQGDHPDLGRGIICVRIVLGMEGGGGGG